MDFSVPVAFRSTRYAQDMTFRLPVALRPLAIPMMPPTPKPAPPVKR